MNSVAVFVVWLYVEGVARDQPPDLCRDVVSTVAQTFSYEIIGRQVLDWVVRTFDVVRYVSVVGKVPDEPRPRAGDDGDVFSNLLAQRLGDDARVYFIHGDGHLSL